MNIGIHIRLPRSITAVAKKALRLELPFFQTFVLTAAGRFFTPTIHDTKSFLAIRDKFGPLFLHASYWINGASNSRSVEHLLERELQLANDLAFDFYIIHAGATTYKRHDKRLELLVYRLKKASKKYPRVTILIENTAHANNSIGGSIQELGLLSQKLDHCNNIGFCIDTAHAYSYGYDIVTISQLDKFVTLINQEIGLERIPLIHLNNTNQSCGSHIDIHTPTTKGNIDPKTLAHMANIDVLRTKYFIAELPQLNEKKEKDIINQIKKW